MKNYDIVVDYHIGNRHDYRQPSASMRDFGGLVIPARDEQGCSANLAKFLSVELGYGYYLNDGECPGLMVDYLDLKGIKACLIELFWEDPRLVEELSPLRFKAIQKPCSSLSSITLKARGRRRPFFIEFEL